MQSVVVELRNLDLYPIKTLFAVVKVSFKKTKNQTSAGFGARESISIETLHSLVEDFRTCGGVAAFDCWVSIRTG
jgi:hypothetical protein